ncbi:flavodoxin [Vibrio sp. SCSIO 43137]|uniref:flavodoxin n=1 Tax=Vibrio sp. SCSIO 43137 TaxID=3021011 RepID=UPI002307D9ED|nr:flavodoxin [Vibrio sp. SCSIO 43137]WCE32584.1 flavodoxin [Vibrio sp. SCSIO 43137]
MSAISALIEKKNHWLLSHVDVAFPTAESIKGRELYLQQQQKAQYTEHGVKPEKSPSAHIDDIYLVDFHRLTVMFAQLQAQLWPEPEEQAWVLEFFAQITLSDQHPMYLGFSNGKPVISALVTEMEGELLISDLVSVTDVEDIKPLFAHQLMEIMNTDNRYSRFYILD